MWNSLIAITVTFVLTASANAQLTGPAMPRMPSFTEPAVEAEHGNLTTLRTPLMSIMVRKSWSFHCYAPATMQECMVVGIAAEKAYGSMRPSGFGMRTEDIVETSKWRIICQESTKECPEALSRFQASNVFK